MRYAKALQMRMMLAALDLITTLSRSFFSRLPVCCRSAELLSSGVISLKLLLVTFELP